jgi:hypothetical protein
MPALRALAWQKPAPKYSARRRIGVKKPAMKSATTTHTAKATRAANTEAVADAFTKIAESQRVFEALRGKDPTPPMRARELVTGLIDAVWLLLKAPATKGKATVEKYEETSYNPPMDGLHNYLKSQGVPEPLQPQLAAKIDRLVKAELTGREVAPTLSKTELAAFMTHAASHQWNAESKPKVAPSAFIAETFKDWLGRGLRLKHIRAAQKNLASAYSTEVSREPSKRVAGLSVAQEKLPVGAPRPPSIRPVAELSEKEKAEKRPRDAAKMRRWRQSRQQLSL